MMIELPRPRRVRWRGLEDAVLRRIVVVLLGRLDNGMLWLGHYRTG